MSDIVIKSNRQPRPVLHWHDLTDSERREFDYLDTNEKQVSAWFFRYKGNVYDLEEFNRVPSGEGVTDTFKAWHGIRPDTYFSGVLIRYVNDYEDVIVGRYFS